MFFMKDQKLKPWEIALLIALCILFCAGMWARGAQEDLAESMVRLHVVARSDSADDQAEKLQLRDRVLDILSPALAGCASRADAVNIILDRQAELEALGDVSVSLGEEYYPTRDYATFSLPAGQYLSLRVTMGQGQGKNWWCVVFPPLCTEALAEPAQDAFQQLAPADAATVTQDGDGYVIRFRLLDWWGKLVELFS